ncbi:MAG: CRISPR-associated protein Cas4 [Dehalococcoidia bacterium]
MTGKVDIIECHSRPNGIEIPFPVEYKRGPRRKYDQSDIQLCAQGICLEEMLGVPVPAGAVYFGGAHRRREVAFSEGLRRLVEETARDVRALIERGETPAAKLGPWCDGCSLRGICIPEVTGPVDRSAAYLQAILQVPEGGPL